MITVAKRKTCSIYKPNFEKMFFFYKIEINGRKYIYNFFGDFYVLEGCFHTCQIWLAKLDSTLNPRPF